MATGPPERLPDLLIAAAGNRIGHQGLRFERYDTPWFGGAGGLSGVAGPLTHASMYPIGAPQTIPADAYTPVHGQYHNRNRMYSPALGRFLSRDPNALGTPVLSDLSFGGMALDASDVAPDLTAHYADGLNTHAAYGSNPLTQSDASGLFYAVDIGMTVGQMANDLVSQYSLNLMHDVHWASDWNQPDNGHTRNEASWVTEILMRHALNGVADAVFGPVATLRDLVALGEVIGEYLIGDDGEELELELAAGGDDHEAPFAVASNSALRNLPRRGPGHNRAAAIGMAKHAQFSQKMRAKGYVTNRALSNGKRPDAYHVGKKEVVELKPFPKNGGGVSSRARRQLEGYRKQCEKEFRGKWKARFEFY